MNIFILIGITAFVAGLLIFLFASFVSRKVTRKKEKITGLIIGILRGRYHSLSMAFPTPSEITKRD